MRDVPRKVDGGIRLFEGEDGQNATRKAQRERQSDVDAGKGEYPKVIEARDGVVAVEETVNLSTL